MPTHFKARAGMGISAKESELAGAELCQAQIKLGLVWFDHKLFLNGDLFKDRINSLYN